MKKHVMISVDEEVHKEVKEKELNVSEIVEKALKEKLGKTEVEIPTSNKCDFCGKEGTPETRETINETNEGLSWLYPDERWICNRCLKNKSQVKTNLA
jgi:hypothetical protein